MNFLKHINSLLGNLPMVSWLSKTLGNDPTHSSSRAVQAAVVSSTITMLWLSLAHTGWVINDAWASVLKTLIITAGGAYVGGKGAEAFGNNKPKEEQ